MGQSIIHHIGTFLCIALQFTFFYEPQIYEKTRPYMRSVGYFSSICSGDSSVALLLRNDGLCARKKGSEVKWQSHFTSLPLPLMHKGVISSLL